MKVAMILLSSLSLIGCAMPNMSVDAVSPVNAAPSVVAVKPFAGNPNTSALETQLQQHYAGTQVQVLRVGNEIKVTYSSDQLFGVGGVTLLTESQTVLNALIKVATTYPQTKVRVDCFTDNSGSPSLNITRSQDRAQNVANYLINHGIPADQITFKGYASDFPVAENDTKEGRAADRRVVITISDIPLPQPAV